jgi:hypothetical protein
MVPLVYFPKNSVQGFPHSHQHLLLCVFLKFAILTEVRWNFGVVITCISFMAKNSGQFFMYLLAICTSEKYLLYSFSHLLIESFVLLEFCEMVV